MREFINDIPYHDVCYCRYSRRRLHVVVDLERLDAVRDVAPLRSLERVEGTILVAVLDTLARACGEFRHPANAWNAARDQLYENFRNMR